MIATGNINRPNDHYELGEHVRYHHRVCVARIPKPKYLGRTLNEGKWECITSEGGRPPFDDDDFFTTESFVSRMPTEGKRINKTLIIWPERGEGIITGLIRRGIGCSHSGYESGGYEYPPEYEPGFFDVQEWHWLYVIRTTIWDNTKGVYAPMWAVQKK